jgi:rhodanese-related sulfurtransferase
MTIEPAALLAAIERGEAPVVVDVRSWTEYVAGHVPGAIQTSYWRLLFAGPANVTRTARVVVYCGTGPRAAIAALGLRWRGYPNVSDLAGHWAAWQRESLPRRSGSRP